MRNSYNLALSNYGEWFGEHVIKLLEACQRVSVTLLRVLAV